jgi:tetratricopeptide (TPR) repeat protein
MSDVIPLKYVAFLSYSHRDQEFGEAVHRELENYRIPADLVGKAGFHGAIPSKLRPIFRDRFDLEAGPSLRDQVTEAIANSQAMVVICSPASARSPYVNEEIRQFKALGRAHRIYPIIIDGEPGDPEHECFPPALRHVVDADGNITAFLEEPIAADAREHADGKELARTKIISGLLGVDLDRLRRREAEDQRRQKRFWIGLSSGMALLAVAALAAFVVAWIQREEKKVALTKNEELLDATLGRTSSLVSNAVNAVRRNGLPIKFGLEILEEAKGYFDDMDKVKVSSRKLPLRRAELQIGLAGSYRQLGDGDKALDYARQARQALFNERDRRESAGEPIGSDLHFQIARSQIYLARGLTDRSWLDFAIARAREGITVIDKQLGGMQSRNPYWLKLRADLNMEVSRNYRLRRQWNEAMRYIAEAREVGNLLGQLGHTKQAAAISAISMINQADLERSRGEIDSAMATNVESEKLVRAAIQLHPGDLIWKARLHRLLIVRADIHRAAGHKQKALEVYKKTKDLVEKAHQLDPHNADAATQYALSNLKISEVADDLGDLALAENASIKACDTYQGLIDRDPESRRFTITYLHALQSLGEVQRKLRKTEAMGASHERRLKVARRFLDKEPTNPELLGQAATSAFMAGESYRMRGRRLSAREKYELAKYYRDRLIEAGQDSPAVRFERAWAIVSIGHSYQDEGKPADALPLYIQAYGLMEPLMSSFKQGGWTHSRFIATAESVARTLSETGNPQAGLEWFETAIEQRRVLALAKRTYSSGRKLAHTREMMADSLLELGNMRKAVGLYEQSLQFRAEALQEKPGDAQRRRNLANTRKLVAIVHLRLGQCPPAHDLLAKAHEGVTRAISDHEKATGEIKSGWPEQQKQIELLQAKAADECPLPPDASLSPGTKTAAAETDW